MWNSNNKCVTPPLNSRGSLEDAMQEIIDSQLQARGFTPIRDGGGCFPQPPAGFRSAQVLQHPEVLQPNDFANSIPATDTLDHYKNVTPVSAAVLQLPICARGLKNAAKLLSTANTEQEEQLATCATHDSLGYTRGVLAGMGCVYPDLDPDNTQMDRISRAGACEKLGEHLDKMYEKHISGGSRGYAEDLGKTVDLVKECYDSLNS